MWQKKGVHCVLLAVCVLSTSACSQLGVKSWERQSLAKTDMAIVDDPITHAFDEHIYFSKEASSGGNSFGGGGCGCN